VPLCHPCAGHGTCVPFTHLANRSRRGPGPSARLPLLGPPHGGTRPRPRAGPAAQPRDDRAPVRAHGRTVVLCTQEKTAGSTQDFASYLLHGLLFLQMCREVGQHHVQPAQEPLQGLTSLGVAVTCSLQGRSRTATCSLGRALRTDASTWNTTAMAWELVEARERKRAAAEAALHGGRTSIARSRAALGPDASSPDALIGETPLLQLSGVAQHRGPRPGVLLPL
jgi:hypothetical protein